MTEYETACAGKTHFPTRNAAKKRANQIRRNGGPTMRAYACDYWDHYHLGHRPGHATYQRHGQPIPETTK